MVLLIATTAGRYRNFKPRAGRADDTFVTSAKLPLPTDTLKPAHPTTATMDMYERPMSPLANGAFIANNTQVNSNRAAPAGAAHAEAPGQGVHGRTFLSSSATTLIHRRCRLRARRRGPAAANSTMHRLSAASSSTASTRASTTSRPRRCRRARTAASTAASSSGWPRSSASASASRSTTPRSPSRCRNKRAARGRGIHQAPVRRLGGWAAWRSRRYTGNVPLRI